MRLILAQDDNRGSGHNNASNSSADYMENKVNDIPQVCLDLKNHIFYHGHLGYFPLVKPNDLLEDMVNTTSKRGIFRISNDIVSRLNLQVITSTGEYACMYLHLLPTIQPTIVGFAVDPLYEYVQYLPTLSFATNLLLGVLFTSINIQQVNINLDPNNNNKIIMEFLWTGGNIPYSTQPNVAIGVTELGPTTKIRAIIEVHYGTIKISSIYPIANQVHH
jgi:hypothetical protein